MTDKTTADQVHAWMEQVKDGTANPDDARGKEQYEAIVAEYEKLLDILGIGAGQLDVKDAVALLGVAISRVHGARL